MIKKTGVIIVRSGYVGMSLAVLLALDSNILVLDIDADRAEQFDARRSTVADPEIERLL